MDTPQDGIIVDESGCEADDLAYCGAVRATVRPDLSWAAVVSRAVRSGWVGIEATGSLTGDVAEVVAANGTRNGQSVGDVVDSVRTWDRELGSQRTFAAADCGFEQGGSRLQETLADGSARFEVLDATFLLRQGDLSAPVADLGLATLLGISPGARVRLEDVLAATDGASAQTSVAG